MPPLDSRHSIRKHFSSTPLSHSLKIINVKSTLYFSCDLNSFIINWINYAGQVGQKKDVNKSLSEVQIMAIHLENL